MTEGLLAKNTAGVYHFSPVDIIVRLIKTLVLPRGDQFQLISPVSLLNVQQSRPQPRRQSRHSRYRLFSTTAIGNFTSQTIVPGRFTSYGPHSSYRTESKPTSSALGTEATCPKSTYLNALGIAEC